MIPSRALATTISAALAADAATLAHATLPIKVGLIIAPFVPSLDRVAADLTLGSTTGLIPIVGLVGTQLESVDPVTGELIVQLKPAAGGWYWETPVGFTGPITVYGFAVLNNALTVLYATETLPEPILLNTENQSITAAPLKFRIDPTKIH